MPSVNFLRRFSLKITHVHLAPPRLCSSSSKNSSILENSRKKGVNIIRNGISSPLPHLELVDISTANWVHMAIFCPRIVKNWSDMVHILLSDYSIIVDDILLLEVSTYFHASSPKNSHCVRQIPLNTKFHRALLYGLTYGYWKLFE